MTDTFDSSSAADADTLLPPLTAAIRKVWRDAGPASAQMGAVADPDSMRKVLDAIHGLELRVITLEGGTFP